MKKLKWININYYNDQEMPVNFNFGYYFLKSYYKFRGKHYNNIDWQLPIVYPNVEIDDMLQEVVQDAPDIFCLSVYLWNRNHSFALADAVKQALPNTIIVMGGPEIDAHRNKQFFVDHPNIDYVVYGSGEEGFKYLLDALVVDEPIPEDAVNIVTRDNLWMHRIFDDKQYKSVSPVIDMKDEIERDYFRLKEYVRHQSSLLDSNNNKELGPLTGVSDVITVRIERARGCPYACTFCDWNSGLHNKVKRKTSNWREEIDFFKSLGPGLRVEPMDANWGIYPEDIEITKYALAELEYFGIPNVAKLNKERVFEIFELQAQHAKTKNRDLWLKVSLQDIHEHILEAIDRPDIPWLKHKEMLQEFISHHDHVRYKAETIIGLPGQTVDLYREQLVEMQEASIHNCVSYFWEILPNSPAFDPKYQEKYQIKRSNIITPLSVVDTVDEIKHMVDNNAPGWMENFYVTGSNVADFSDIIEMYMMAKVYTHIKFLFPNMTRPADILYKKKDNIRRASEALADNVLKHSVLGTNFRGKFYSLWQYSRDHDAIMEIIK